MLISISGECRSLCQELTMAEDNPHIMQRITTFCFCLGYCGIHVSIMCPCLIMTQPWGPTHQWAGFPTCNVYGCMFSESDWKNCGLTPIRRPFKRVKLTQSRSQPLGQTTARSWNNDKMQETGRERGASTCPAKREGVKMRKEWRGTGWARPTNSWKTCRRTSPNKQQVGLQDFSISWGMPLKA